MKKAILFFAAVIFNIFLACNGAQDNKNDVEPYPTYDTTRPVEQKNINDSIRGGGIEVENPQDKDIGHGN